MKEVDTIDKDVLKYGEVLFCDQASCSFTFARPNRHALTKRAV